MSMQTVKDHLGKYANPDFSVAGDDDEREAMQRLNLHSAMMDAKHLHWLFEKVIELRVADTGVEEWSEQGRRLVKHCFWATVTGRKTHIRLANAVASGKDEACEGLASSIVHQLVKNQLSRNSKRHSQV